MTSDVGDRKSADSSSEQHGAVVKEGRGVKEGDDDEHEDASAFFTAKFSALSMAEREEEMYAIHGVANYPAKETPEFLQEKVTELLGILDQIQEGREAYDLALKQDLGRGVVTNQTFLQSYLRATIFNVEEAAQKITKFYTFKRELFGDEKLAKELTLQDLDSEARELLERGWLSKLPLHDLSGRAVAILLVGIKDAHKYSQISRVCRFTSMIIPVFDGEPGAKSNR